MSDLTDTNTSNVTNNSFINDAVLLVASNFTGGVRGSPGFINSGTTMNFAFGAEINPFDFAVIN